MGVWWFVLDHGNVSLTIALPMADPPRKSDRQDQPVCENYNTLTSVRTREAWDHWRDFGHFTECWVLKRHLKHAVNGDSPCHKFLKQRRWLKILCRKKAMTSIVVPKNLQQEPVSRKLVWRKQTVFPLPGDLERQPVSNCEMPPCEARVIIW